MPKRLPGRGFTLVELLLVISVIVLLMGIAYPAWNVIRNSQRKSGAKVLVGNVAMAIQQYPGGDMWALPTPGGPTPYINVVLWDWNGDQVLDGNPAVETRGDLSLRAQVAASGYQGFAAQTGFQSGARFGLGRQGERLETASVAWALEGKLLDPWRRPLRIAHAAAKIYGGERFGVWSTGPDGANDQDWPNGCDGDQARRADNLRSWKD